MKTIRNLTATILALLTSIVSAQSIAPYYDVIGNMSVDGSDVTQASLSTWNPYTLDVPVPPDSVQATPGFAIGFGSIASVNEQQVTLDSIRVTKFSYSVYHLDVTTGSETPVLRADGTPMTNINLLQFADESTSSRPTLFTTAPDPSYKSLAGAVNSVNENSSSSSVTHVSALFSTKLNFTWGSTPDLTRPTVNNGYSVHWDVRFIPVHLGVQYPEVKLSTNSDGDIKFTYQVIDMPLPKMTLLKPLRDVYPTNPDQGIVLRMQSPYLEFFKLQRSTDLVAWTDWDFGGEGGNWVEPFNVPAGDGGYYSNTYQWIMFDRNYPDERRQPTSEFYRMVWTGKKGVWRIVMYP